MHQLVSQVASYMKAINDIYDKADFDGIELVNFKVKFLSVRSLFWSGLNKVVTLSFALFYCPVRR